MWYNDLRPERELTTPRYSLVFYKDNEIFDDAGKKRTIKNLLKLKEALANEIPKKEVEKNLLLASWNVKEFGHLKERLPESLYYIAEIISAFDIVAVQEIKSSLDNFNKVMKILGSHWSYIITDTTEGRAGNRERSGYIFDTRKVLPSGLAGELVISPELADSATELRQLKRTPSITGFETGWKKFAIINVHLHPGDKVKDGIPVDQNKRKEEVRLLLDLIQEKFDKENLWSENLVILGDTNLYKNDDDIVQILTDKKFREAEGLVGKFTNTSQSQIYDRIFMNLDHYYKLIRDEHGVEKGSVFNLYEHIYTEESRPEYHADMLAHKDDPSTLQDDADFKSYFHRYWKRNQISDHLPVWLEMEIDSSADFLANKLKRL